MPDQPTGTVTFLFTDIEGSTKLWEQHPDAMRQALARHDAVLRTAIEDTGGYVFKTIGDAFCAAFDAAPSAISAAIDAQRTLATEQWGETGPLKVRMALHTGLTEAREGDYFGTPVNRVSRLLSAGHGGQVLLSQTTFELLRDDLPDGASLDDLGEHRLKDLSRPEGVYQLTSPGLAIQFAALKTLDTRPNNLPMQPTVLIGRERESEQVRALLLRPEVRLVTLIGPGGTGKTRLGLQVAADLIDEFEHGVFYVALDPITDPDLVASTIASTLGVQGSGSQPILEILKNYLEAKQMLLVLDNFEQVVSAAPVVSDLLAVCPRLKVLATSREVLHLQGEHDCPVPPLSLPEDEIKGLKGAELLTALSQYESVRLFIERAVSVKPDFAVTSENAPAVAEICHRLDGLPLAIELAVARIRLLTPQKMLERMEKRLPWLTRGAKDLPARQQTLRGAIAWSYDLLEEEERVLFRRLAVFAGGCTMEAAEDVCGDVANVEIDVFDALASLEEKSLIRQVEAASEPRFAMLETVREYALDRLADSGEEDLLCRQQAESCLSLLRQAELHGPEQMAWINRLKLELNNLRGALAWSVKSGEAELCLELASGPWDLWMLLSSGLEGYDWLEKALAIAGDAPETTRAKAMCAASFYVYSYDTERSKELLDESLVLRRRLEDRTGLADSLYMLGLWHIWQQNYTEAEDAFDESLAISRELGYGFGMSRSLIWSGNAARELGEHEKAQARGQEALAQSRALGDIWVAAWALWSLGNTAFYVDDYGRAADHFEKALKIERAIDFKPGVVRNLRGLARVLIAQDDTGKAKTQLCEAVAILLDLGQKSLEGMNEILELLAIVALKQNHLDRAVREFGAVEAAREARNMPWLNKARYEKIIVAARDELGDERFASLWAEGRSMSKEEAIKLALE